MNTRQIAIRSAVTTAVTLVGGMILGFASGSILFESLPGHMLEEAKIGLSVAPMLAGLIGGGAAWGWAIGRLEGSEERHRMVWAGVLGFSLPVLAAAFGLLGLESYLETLARRAAGQPVPTHVIFTLLFVPTAFILAASGGGALGVALRDRGLAWRLALLGGLAAGMAFLGVNLAMDALGWRVGAPGAAERSTMITVLFVSNVGAALAGGAAIGAVLASRKDERIGSLTLK